MGLGFGCLVLKQQGYLRILGVFQEILEADTGGFLGRTRLLVLRSLLEGAEASRRVQEPL